MGGLDKSDSEFAHRLLRRAPARSTKTAPRVPGQVFFTIPAFEDDHTSQTVILETETGLARIGDPVRLLLDDPQDDLDGLVWDCIVIDVNKVKATFFLNTDEDYRPSTTVQMRLEPYPRKKLFPEIRTELW